VLHCLSPARLLRQLCGRGARLAALVVSVWSLPAMPERPLPHLTRYTCLPCADAHAAITDGSGSFIVH
jgi:hypothetical protein